MTGRLSKTLLLLLISLVLFADRSHSFTTSNQGITDREDVGAVGLSVKVMSSEYCVGDAELDGLRLKVRLIYTNKGSEKIILYKGSRLVSKTMISRNFEEAAARHFEINSSQTQLTAGGNECYRGAVPNKCFVVLAPGASYEVEGIVGAFVVRGDAREITGAVKSGEHVFQVEVVTWYESNEMAKNLRARWLRHGILWFQPITSAPAPFSVEQNRRVVDCP